MTQEHRFNTPGPVELEVAVPSGEIVVETVEGDESHVVLDGNERTLEQTVVELDGDRLRVELRARKTFGLTIEIGDISFGGGASGKLSVRATIPHGSHVTVSTASADTRLRGRFGNLATKSASGDLVVDGPVEGNAVVKTVSGDARLQDVAGTLHMQGVSGDLRVQTVGGSLMAKSVSGDVRVDSLREGEATLQSVSGDIQLGIAPGTNVDVDANSVSGDLSSDVALADDPAMAHDGDGPTLVVRGKTVSGDFKLIRA